MIYKYETLDIQGLSGLSVHRFEVNDKIKDYPIESQKMQPSANSIIVRN